MIVGATDGSVDVFLLAMLITVVVSELSYRFIETPVREGAINAIVHGNGSDPELEVNITLTANEEGFSAQDAAVANLARERGCSTAILANKWDALAKDRREPLREAVRHGLRFLSHCPELTVSAATGFVWKKPNQVVTSLHLMRSGSGAKIIVAA